MSDTSNMETYATFDLDGATYEIDHLGIGYASQWGQFAIYKDGDQIAEFAIAESLLRPEYRPSALPVSDDELIRLAKEALLAA